MLKHLTIKNYAIIEELHIAFDAHLNIITGETGAGKSIILGALNMILGRRADTSVLRNPEKKAVIEGIFDIGHLDLADLFRELDLDYEQETIVRREIRPNGKSRAFVNDSPVNLDQLRSLALQLVDLHAQQDTTSVVDRKFYTNILDSLAGQQKTAEAYRRDYRKFRQLERELETARQRLNDQRSDQDYLEFQFNELYEMRLVPEDGQPLADELNMLEHAGQILEHLQAAVTLLQEGEVNAEGVLGEAADQLARISGYGKDLRDLHERLTGLEIELRDIARSAESIAEGTELDEERLEALNERHSAVNKLLQKHQVAEVEELIQLRDELKARLADLETSGEDLSAMDAAVKKMHSDLQARAAELSTGRHAQVAGFEADIAAILRELGMPHARVALNNTYSEAGSLNEMGIDNFGLSFSANKGIELQPLKQVASGGERSRLMLAIKSILARHMQLSTMIFDEIDTGVSGEVAARVGDIFKRMAAGHQIISITHLPQIAAQADRHLFVYKDDAAEKTAAMVRVLDQNESVVEIAKMLSGDQPGDAAILTARELIGGSLN